MRKMRVIAAGVAAGAVLLMAAIPTTLLLVPSYFSAPSGGAAPIPVWSMNGYGGASTTLYSGGALITNGSPNDLRYAFSPFGGGSTAYGGFGLSTPFGFSAVDAGAIQLGEGGNSSYISGGTASQPCLLLYPGTNTTVTATFCPSSTQIQGTVSVGSIKPTAYIVAALPSASSLGAGSTLIVSDATTYTPGTCTGGGSNYVIAVSNGTTWSCH